VYPDDLIQNKQRKMLRGSLLSLCAGAAFGPSAHVRQVSEIDMGKLKIPHDAIVFVGDGRKALFLRNEGDEKFPNLKTEKVFEHINPSTHEQGSERPGRVSESHSGRRSAIEPVDWHDLEERRFTREVAAAAEQIVSQPQGQGSCRRGAAADPGRASTCLSSRRETAYPGGVRQGSDQASRRRNRKASCWMIGE
jgi:protein required for attachment to host cells